MADILYPCGCWDQRAPAISLNDPKPMPERSEYTDGAWFIRHYCEEHWRERRMGEMHNPNASKD